MYKNKYSKDLNIDDNVMLNIYQLMTKIIALNHEDNDKFGKATKLM